MNLAFAPSGKELRITGITADEKISRHLESLGFTVGSVITALLSNNGDVIVKIRDGKLALNRALAMKILVAI